MSSSITAELELPTEYHNDTLHFRAIAWENGRVSVTIAPKAPTISCRGGLDVREREVWCRDVEGKPIMHTYLPAWAARRLDVFLSHHVDGHTAD